MLISNYLLNQIAILLLALSGLGIALYIFRKKRRQSPLVCPIKFDCNTVVNSDYSKFFGIPVEILGLVYYGFIALSYIFLIVLTGEFPFILIGILIIATTLAFLFSMYLMFVQFFVIRKGCSWCILSAALSTLIFLLTVANYNLL
jgi:uncharacterized membrane protein